MNTVLVTSTYDTVSGGVCPPSQMVVPLSTEKKYRPEVAEADVDKLASIRLMSLVKVWVSYIVVVSSTCSDTVDGLGGWLDVPTAVGVVIPEAIEVTELMSSVTVSVTVTVAKTVEYVVGALLHSTSFLERSPQLVRSSRSIPCNIDIQHVVILFHS